jgi:hypothetical protein
MAYVIPDIPAEVRMQIQQERLLAKEAKFDSQKFDLNRSASEGNQSPNIHPPIIPENCSGVQNPKMLVQNVVWDQSQ